MRAEVGADCLFGTTSPHGRIRQDRFTVRLSFQLSGPTASAFNGMSRERAAA